MTRFLRRPEVEGIVALRSSSIYRMMGEGLFPKGVKIGDARRWPSDDIERWMDEQRANEQPDLPSAA